MSVLTVPVADEDRSIIVAARSLAASLLRDEPQRFRHVEGAARAAAHVTARVPDLPRGPVIAAAWLHDIGYATGLRVTGFHPVDGAVFLAEGGWDDAVVRLVAHHSHARVLAPYCNAEAALSRFPLVPGLAGDVVAFADLVSGVNGSGVTVADRIAELRSRPQGALRVPDEVRETRFRLLRVSADNVRHSIRRAVRTGD